MKSEKNHFSVLFYSANPFQTILPCKNFSMYFFEKSIFFTLSNTILQRWEMIRSEKNQSWCSFIVQNPFQTILPCQNFFMFFFEKLIFFTVSATILQRWETWGHKKTFLVRFYSAKSIWDHFTISKLFQVVFSKNQYFSLFRPLYCEGEKHEVRKKSLFSALS